MSTAPICRSCSTLLVKGYAKAGGNWSISNSERGSRLCSPCKVKQVKAWQAANPDRTHAQSRRIYAKNAGQKLYALANDGLLPDYIKIGKTIVNPKFRLATYNTGDPLRRYRFAHIVEVPDAGVAEDAAFKALADCRIPATEWFRCSEARAIEVLNSLAI